MALTGNYTHYSYEYHPTETVEHTVTYPADLSAENPHYEFRGTTQIVTSPKQVENTQLYENVYIIIRTSNIQALTISPKTLVHEGFWRIYASKEAKENNPEEYLGEFHFSLNWDWELQSNPYVEGYNYIKTLPGADELIDN